MQKISRIYSRTRMGIDFRVWLTLLITAIVSLALLAFRIATTETCSPVSFSLKGTMNHSSRNNYYTGEHILFGVQMSKASDIVWDFGDGSDVVKGNPAAHSYKNEGNFLVTVVINGRCRESINIRISQVSFTTVPTPAVRGNEANVIIGKDYATTGELCIYQTDTSAALYEWTVENNAAFPTKSGSKVSYSFTDAGTYILKLKLDNDLAKVYRKTIIVTAGATQSKGAMPDELPPLPLPVPKEKDASPEPGSGGNGSPESPAVAEKKFEIIPNQIFKDNFQAFVEGKGAIDDIARYLCEGANTKVRGNGKTYSSLTLFCEELKGKKGVLGLGGKRKIKSVNAKREVGSNCVYWLDVEYK